MEKYKTLEEIKAYVTGRNAYYDRPFSHAVIPYGKDFMSDNDIHVYAQTGTPAKSIIVMDWSRGEAYVLMYGRLKRFQIGRPR